jgi:hypothetical protein
MRCKRMLRIRDDPARPGSRSRQGTSSRHRPR